jgi:hypothetical protein
MPMMGSKQRHFAALIRVSLEELVPRDHFYRHLEQTLDLTWGSYNVPVTRGHMRLIRNAEV